MKIVRFVIRRVKNNFTLRIYTCKQVVRKHFFDENYFDLIDTEAKAYILGFLYADGWNYQNAKNYCYSVCLEIQKRDVEILEFIAKEMKISQPIQFGLPKTNQFRGRTILGRGCAKIVLSSKPFSIKMSNLGLTPRKSLTLEFPDIPEKLIRHFVRGYFDGDGSITFSYSKKGIKNIYFSLLSSMSFCQKLSELLLSNFNIKAPVTLKKDSQIYNICIGGNKQVIAILDWLYRDSNFSLLRKREKFINFLRSYAFLDFKMDTSKFILDRQEIISHYANL